METQVFFYYNKDMSIQVKHLKKTFNNHIVLDDISFEIDDSSRIAIVGSSGVGKTTLLRILAGLESYDSGEVILNNQNIAMIFQDGGLFEHALVKDNITLGLKKLGYSKEEISDSLKDISQMLHIEALLNRYPISLSSGEKQRVGIARALIRKPSILLLDEPFSNLDAELRYSLKKELLDLQESLHMTLIVVTHDIDEAFYFGQKILLLKDTKLIEEASSEDILKKPSSLESCLFFYPDSNAIKMNIKENTLYLDNIEIMNVISDSTVVNVVVPKESIILGEGYLQGVLENYIVQRNGYFYTLKFNEYKLNVFTTKKFELGTINFTFTNHIYLYSVNDVSK